MSTRRRRFTREVMVLVMLTGILTGDGLAEQGAYYARKKYVPKPLPVFGAAFNQNIFLWGTCFLTMFCNYAHPYVPGICSLDNFYAKQHEDGEICREINRTTGKDFAPWVNREGKPLFSRWGYDWDKGQKRVGVEKFWFGGKTVSFVCHEPDARGIRRVSVLSDGGFRLKIRLGGKIKITDIPAQEPVKIDI